MEEYQGSGGSENCDEVESAEKQLEKLRIWRDNIQTRYTARGVLVGIGGRRVRIFFCGVAEKIQGFEEWQRKRDRVAREYGVGGNFLKAVQNFV